MDLPVGLSRGQHPAAFFATLACLALFIVALVVTLAVEVAIGNRIRAWTLDSLPADWREQRDRWEVFHAVRTAASVAGLVLLVAGALFG